jgi:hypothetical protein
MQQKNIVRQWRSFRAFFKSHTIKRWTEHSFNFLKENIVSRFANKRDFLTNIFLTYRLTKNYG